MSTFTDGESIADVEVRLGRTVGPVMLKLELLANYAGNGKVIEVTATHATQGTKTLRATITPGSVAGDIFLLDGAPHDTYPRGYYIDVTSMREVSGDGYCLVRVVNDGPAWASSTGVAIESGAYSPFACDVRLSVRDPFLATDFLGQAHLVYIRDGQVMHTVYNEHSGIDTPVSVTHSAGVYAQHEEPSLVCCDDGRLLVAATSGGATRLYASFDGGFSWFQGGV